MVYWADDCGKGDSEISRTICQKVPRCLMSRFLYRGTADHGSKPSGILGPASVSGGILMGESCSDHSLA
jgi:hypothetical protein